MLKTCHGDRTSEDLVNPQLSSEGLNSKMDNSTSNQIDHSLDINPEVSTKSQKLGVNLNTSLDLKEIEASVKGMKK